MKIKKYQNGGTNPGGPTPPEVQANPSLAPDYRGVEPSLYDLGYEGPATMRPDLLFDAVGLPGLIKTLPSLARGAYSVLKNPKATYDALRGVATGGSAAASEIDMASKQALDALRRKQLDDQLQNVAERAVREGAREESQNILDLQRSMQSVLDDAISESKSIDELQEAAQKIIDDMELQGFLDESQYSRFLRDIDAVFNEARGGSVSTPGAPIIDNPFTSEALFKASEARRRKRIQEGLEGQFSRILRDRNLGLRRYSGASKPFFTPNFEMNRNGGKIKVLKRR